MTETDPTARIDPELQQHLTRVLDLDEPPQTFGEAYRTVIGVFADELGRDLTVDDLCTTDRSPHWATVDGETQHYQCVTDGFILGHVVDDPVTVRTESPVTGTELVVEFDSDGAVSVPEGAQLSFGVHQEVSPPDQPVTAEEMYARFCPYSLAFPSREEYDQWAETSPAVVSDVQPLDDALALQADLFGDTADQSAEIPVAEGGGTEAVSCACCTGGESE